MASKWECTLRAMPRYVCKAKWTYAGDLEVRQPHAEPTKPTHDHHDLLARAGMAATWKKYIPKPGIRRLPRQTPQVYYVVDKLHK